MWVLTPGIMWLAGILASAVVGPLMMREHSSLLSVADQSGDLPVEGLL
jgi:hypothetical protein